jgi:hypothetical protein
MRPLLWGPVMHPEMDGHGAFPSADSFVRQERARRGTFLSNWTARLYSR